MHGDLFRKAIQYRIGSRCRGIWKLSKVNGREHKYCGTCKYCSCSRLDILGSENGGIGAFLHLGDTMRQYRCGRRSIILFW